MSLRERSRQLSYLRRQVIGWDLAFRTPFGLRHLFYADFTASGRSLALIEKKMLNIQKSYANTHTEDDYSGKYLTRLFHAAEQRIKEIVNAGENGKVFPVGSGSTGALKKLQEIIGVYIPPLAKERIEGICRDAKEEGAAVFSMLEKSKPVVFIGPYEHHTNELMWREAFVDVTVVKLAADGRIDLTDLENRITDAKYRGRMKFGSFSAGSNITGVRTRVYDVARICHRHGIPVFFDFAAIAPYAEINMNRDRESYFDAIFFSPHKFLGGPGSCGILVMNDRLYRSDLPPTTAGGGTVVYVGPQYHDYSEDIETREMAGTPPILQTIKAALVMDLKEKIGVKTIAKIEAAYLSEFLETLKKIENVRLVGRYDTGDLTPIVSFNIVHEGRILHPKFVTKLLNDLFGIQSRAGCSCAGPYGHILLGIDDDTSLRFREIIGRGLQGIKPGWVRINLHYIFTRKDIDFLLKAIRFVARQGRQFLRRYAFDFKTGEWTFMGFQEKKEKVSVDCDYSAPSTDLSKIESLRLSYFRKAEAEARKLMSLGDMKFAVDEDRLESLKNFYYIHRK